MANKRIALNAPDTVAGVQRRVARIEAGSKDARRGSFNDLVLDTLVGIAEGQKEGCRKPDDPVEVAREVLRYGAIVYDAPGLWITWDGSSND